MMPEAANIRKSTLIEPTERWKILGTMGKLKRASQKVKSRCQPRLGSRGEVYSHEILNDVPLDNHETVLNGSAAEGADDDSGRKNIAGGPDTCSHVEIDPEAENQGDPLQIVRQPNSDAVDVGVADDLAVAFILGELSVCGCERNDREESEGSHESGPASARSVEHLNSQGLDSDFNHL